MPSANNAETVWFLLGAALMIAELASPGFILFFFGLGAWFAALTTWVGLTQGLAAQLTVFIVASLVFLVSLRRYGRSLFRGRMLPGRQNETLNGDVRGEKVRVVEAIEPGTLRGKVELHGTRWNADADAPIEAGATAQVTGRSGLTLTVRRVAP